MSLKEKIISFSEKAGDWVEEHISKPISEHVISNGKKLLKNAVKWVKKLITKIRKKLGKIILNLIMETIAEIDEIPDNQVFVTDYLDATGEVWNPTKLEDEDDMTDSTYNYDWSRLSPEEDKNGEESND